jgi:two-component system, chemotaxis family, chemotaxis protein CheY
MPGVILSVDDSPLMRRMVKATLESSGHEVLEAADGKQALALAKTRRLDVVVADLHMPAMDGLALTRRLRQMPEYRQAPILLLTSESNARRMQMGRACGVTDWIVKPFDPGAFVAAVAGFL